MLLGLALALGGYLLLRTWSATTGYPEMVAGPGVGRVGLGLALSPIAATVINARSATSGAAAHRRW